MIGGEADVGTFVLQDMQQPVREFDIAIARALGLAQRLNEGVVADPVQLASDRLKTNVRHSLPLVCPKFSLRRCLICSAG